MSKIQDAIRKVQAIGQPATPVVTLARPSGRKKMDNSVIPDLRPVITDSGECDGGLATVNFQLLREMGLLAPEDQEQNSAEQFRMIKRPLLDFASGKGADQAENANIIMVSSALSGDGKTFNSINLALSMALEKDTSVLLVDADVAKPNVSELFGVSDKQGLIDLIIDDKLGIADVVMRTDIPGLSLLPAGSHDDYATELLASRRMANFMEVLSQTFPDRIVIMDSPPLLATNEARVLANLVGQIALVVCAGHTPQAAVTDALESIDDSKAVNLILNRDTPGIGAMQYGNYGHGS
jgi:protein-tyrosine kinase